jgi:putative membrane protein (TIGR04086 family)
VAVTIDQPPRTGLRALDAQAVLVGAGVNVLLTLPLGIIARAMAGSDDQSNWYVVVTPIIAVIAPLIGGALAARHQRTAPLTHGAAATGLAWFVVAAISIIDKAAKHRSVPLVTLLLLGCVSVSFGVIGAYFTFRRELRQTPES